MGFKTVVSLDCDKAISLGGEDRKTRKANPTSIEGYYVGSRKVESAKSKTGFCLLHVFQTSGGLTGVWGKTDLDRKLSSVSPGIMTRASFVGMKETKNNPMYLYKVEIDADNSIDVSGVGASEEGATAEDADAGYDTEEESEDDEAPADEVAPARAQAPRKAAQLPSAAGVKSLLGNRAKSA